MKRLIVACDGTWASSDNGFQRNTWLNPFDTSGKLAIPSNVTRLCRAALPQSKDGVSQVVYYQAGLGSQNNWYSWLIGGYLGEGIGENIREAYAFLATNYEDGDEIYLIGFSRGAFTARSIGGLIASIGLLTRKGLQDFYPIFLDWENQYNPGFVNPWSARLFNNEKLKFNDPRYVRTLIDKKLTRRSIPVKAIAVWDTVGCLGIPDLKFLPSRARKEYSFIDTEVAPNVMNAYQALALDENRTPFSPTVWESPKPGKETILQELKQCWFPGVHSNVGGSYPDTGLGDISLAWLVSCLSRFIAFDPDYVEDQQKLNIQWYKSQPPVETGKSPTIRPWALGKLYRSDGPIDDYLTGVSARTPGEYYVTNPATGHPTPERLRDTKEFIHPSVRVRKTVPTSYWQGIGIPGLGKADSKGSTYDPPPLEESKGWTIYWPGQTWNGEGAKPWPEEHDDWIKWVKVAKGQEPVYICEDRISDADKLQMGLMEDWPEEMRIAEQKSPLT